jgi:DNA (cytosine-5)-methyltransferase 1
MIYGEVCAGISAASVAWKPIGWKAAFYAEIENFPSAVLKHHYPEVPNLGDFTKIKTRPKINLLIGGTPCQDFSLAGLRKGIAGERGNLTLEFLRLADRLRPEWLVWENVRGVLSSDRGRAFGSLLGGMEKLGYGFAYRIFDAQYFGLAQRRARVFVVANSRNWRYPAAVLFDAESMRGNTPPSREAGKELATATSDRPPVGSEGVAKAVLGYNGRNQIEANYIAYALNAKGGSGRIDGESETLIAHTLRAEGFDASEDGTGRGIPLVETLPTMRAGAINRTASHGARSGDTKDEYIVETEWGVRRLTPLECERLQGFPDNYTLVNFRGRSPADGPRYKALGNSIAVPVLKWIGNRIELIEKLR